MLYSWCLYSVTFMYYKAFHFAASTGNTSYNSISTSQVHKFEIIELFYKTFTVQKCKPTRQYYLAQIRPSQSRGQGSKNLSQIFFIYLTQSFSISSLTEYMRKQFFDEIFKKIFKYLWRPYICFEWQLFLASDRFRFISLA